MAIASNILDEELVPKKKTIFASSSLAIVNRENVKKNIAVYILDNNCN